MRRLALAVLVTLVASSAWAVPDGWPVPARYETGPYLNPPVVHRITYEEFRKICPKGAILACALIWPQGNCEIYIRDGFSEDHPTYIYLLRHEQAHCRGWPADHSVPPKV